MNRRPGSGYRGAVPGEFYFMSIGAIGVSLAGFAGLIAALHRTPAAASAVAAYRIKGIVFLGFSLTFIGFGTVGLYSVTGNDLVLTVRLATGLCLLAHMWGFLESRPGPQWRSERERRASLVILTVLTLVTLGNVVVGSIGYLELILLLVLFGPVSIFYNTVRDAAGG